MGHLKHGVLIEAPVEKVWKFADDPHNWATFMTGVSSPEKIIGDVGVGMEVVFPAVVADWHLEEIVRTVEDSCDPDGGGHWRSEFAGSSSGWMTMDFRPKNGGTLVTQEMEYTVPGIASGQVVDRVAFEQAQDQNVLHSLENLKLLMEEPAAPTG